MLHSGEFRAASRDIKLPLQSYRTSPSTASFKLLKASSPTTAGKRHEKFIISPGAGRSLRVSKALLSFQLLAQEPQHEERDIPTFALQVFSDL